MRPIEGVAMTAAAVVMGLILVAAVYGLLAIAGGCHP
jgi:hypothetical protein